MDRRPQLNRAVFYTTLTSPPEVLPALIRRINADGTLDLNVFYALEETGPHVFHNVPYGHSPHSWHWPGPSK